MFILPCRFLVLAALMFWMGGFTFYASVVVPVGREVLGSHLEQGIITQQVSRYLNLAGAFSLLILIGELCAGRDSSKWRRVGRWLLWLGMAGALVVLIATHPRLTQLLDSQEHQLLDRGMFRTRHRFYLWVSTLQWMMSVAYIWLTLWSWRSTDQDEMCAKKSPADGYFGVAQSPEPPLSETPVL